MKKVLSGALIVIAGVVMFSVSTVPAQFCKGDFNYNGSVGAEDVVTFLEHFGRNPFHYPCPPDGPALVSKTGLTKCYRGESPWNEIECQDTGQDGDLLKGVAWPNPRFTIPDYNENVVIDNLTALMWARDANLPNVTKTWAEALDYVNGMNEGAGTYNYADWRLPNIKELQSLIDFSVYNPALSDTAGTGQWSEGNPFYNVLSNYYWSSTTIATFSPGAWGVYMDGGSVDLGNKNDAYYVWPVRYGHPW